MIWDSFRIAKNRSAVKLDHTIRRNKVSQKVSLPKVSLLAATDGVQPAAGGAVCLRPPQLRLRDPG